MGAFVSKPKAHNGKCSQRFGGRPHDGVLRHSNDPAASAGKLAGGLYHYSRVALLRARTYANVTTTESAEVAMSRAATAEIVPFTDTAAGWERALYAFLAEKERRSGSQRTVEAYSRMLQQFFGRLGKAPDEVTSQDVFLFAHGTGPSGRKPSPVTINARAACISSFFRFLIRMDMVTSNPCDRLERPRITPSPPRGLAVTQVRQLLAVIPDTPVGLRDRAIIVTLLLTGRRRAEVLNLKAQDVVQDGDTIVYTYRGKGGKRGRRELPRPAHEAIVRALAAFGLDLTTMDPDASLWPPRRDPASGRGVTSSTFYAKFRRYLTMARLPLSGVHITRHTAARLRRDAGDSIEDVSRFLDHSSLGTTTTYLRQLEGQEDSTWAAVAAAIGVAT